MERLSKNNHRSKEKYERTPFPKRPVNNAGVEKIIRFVVVFPEFSSSPRNFSTLTEGISQRNFFVLT